MPMHVNIDYTEGDPSSYKGVVAAPAKGTKGEPMRWATGHPPTDWEAYLAWAQTQGGLFLMGSSVTHFLWDVPGWRMVLNAKGFETIVPEDRPEWLDPSANPADEPQPSACG